MIRNSDEETIINLDNVCHLMYEMQRLKDVSGTEEMG